LNRKFLAAIGMLTVMLSIVYAADVNVGLDSKNGSSALNIKNSDANIIATIKSSGSLEAGWTAKAYGKYILSGVSDQGDGLVADDTFERVFGLTRNTNNEIRLLGFGPLTFWNGSATGTEKMRIKTNGNVGIGNTDPACRLELSGAGADTGVAIRFDETANRQWALYPNGGTFRIKDLNAGSDYLSIKGGTGYVGIGTTNPVSVLELSGAGGDTGVAVRFDETANRQWALYPTGGTFRIKDLNAGSDYVSVMGGTGWVGIGTTNPIDVMHISDSNANIVYGTSEVINNDAKIGRAGGNNYHITGTLAGDLAIRPESTKKIVFGTASTSGSTATARMVISKDGNIGVGTTAPASVLDVNGDIKLAATSAPTGAAGKIYFDSTTSRLNYHDGSKWIEVDPMYTTKPTKSLNTSGFSGDISSTNTYTANIGSVLANNSIITTIIGRFHVSCSNTVRNLYFELLDGSNNVLVSFICPNSTYMSDYSGLSFCVPWGFTYQLPIPVYVASGNQIKIRISQYGTTYGAATGICTGATVNYIELPL